MWTSDVAPERLAELFHHYHQALMPENGKNREKQDSWKEVPQLEKSRLVAAARLALLELESSAKPEPTSHKYFALPGEAEWGC